jgi:allophanate hydrolase subunit 2
MIIALNVSGLATLQDQGRTQEHLGVPAAGPFDRVRYAKAAALIGEHNPAAIELLHGQISLRLSETLWTNDTDIAEPVIVAVTGLTEATITNLITGRTTGAPTGMSFALYPGHALTVAHIGHGPVYIAVAGLIAEQVLGSASYDTLSRLGGSPLTTGQTLETEAWTAAHEDLIGRFTTAQLPVATYSIRYVPGPHAPTPEFLNHEWAVTAAARSGIRLASTTGEKTPGRADLASLPVTPGTIQLPPDGNPIILGPDAGVTGGYPVVGTVITADLHRLGSMTPGSTIRLTAVTATAAAHLAEEQTRREERTVVTSLYGV